MSNEYAAPSKARYRLPQADPETARLPLAEQLWNWTPHPTQRQWFLANEPINVAACGRRWGKTEATSIDLLTFAFLLRGSRQVVVAPTYDQANLIFDRCSTLALQRPQLAKQCEIRKSPYGEIRIGDSEMMFRSAGTEGRSLRGHSADRIMIDEAAYVQDGVIESVINPMLADTGGQLKMVSTPWGKNHFYRAFLAGLEPGSGCASFQFPSWLNPHISREYVEQQREQLTDRVFRVEYCAEFIDDVSAVFPYDLIAGALRDGCGEGAAIGPVVVGVDWARYSDYTVALALDTGRSPMEVLGFVRFQGLPWAVQVERVARFAEGHRAAGILTDQTALGDPLLEQLREKLRAGGIVSGARVDGLLFTTASKREVIDSLVITLGNRRLAIPSDPTLMNELQFYEYELMPSGNVKMNARSGYHDDIVIALALAVSCAGGLNRGRLAVGGAVGGGRTL